MVKIINVVKLTIAQTIVGEKISRHDIEFDEKTGLGIGKTTNSPLITLTS